MVHGPARNCHVEWKLRSCAASDEFVQAHVGSITYEISGRLVYGRVEVSDYHPEAGFVARYLVITDG